MLVPVTDELLETVSETEEPAFKAVPAPKVIDFNRISGLTMEDLQGVPEENENDLEAVKKAGERDENLAALLPKRERMSFLPWLQEKELFPRHYWFRFL